jgi:hypothetical protein
MSCSFRSRGGRETNEKKKEEGIRLSALFGPLFSLLKHNILSWLWRCSHLYNFLARHILYLILYILVINILYSHLPCEKLILHSAARSARIDRTWVPLPAESGDGEPETHVSCWTTCRPHQWSLLFPLPSVHRAVSCFRLVFLFFPFQSFSMLSTSKYYINV